MKLERITKAPKQAASDDNAQPVILSNASKHATVIGAPGHLVTVRIAPESEIESVTVVDFNGTRVVKRNVDRHKPGYQAAKQREYRARKKAEK